MRSKTTLAKPAGYRPILNIENAKTSKGEALGILTGIWYGSPADESGVMNTCWFASKYCKATCLISGGHLQFDRNRDVRIEKTRMLFFNRELFLACLRYDIQRLVRRAEKKGLTPAVRCNGTTDLAWLAMQFAREFPALQFYDYTKLPKPELRVRANYHLTFSHSGENLAECLRVLAQGINVAVVFRARKKESLPATWHGYRVIDGDLHDVRFLDKDQLREGETAVVVGLRPKGKAKKAVCNPFVIERESAAPLIQILPMAA